MTIRELITDFFRVAKDDEEIIRNEIRDENIRRIFYLSVIAIPVSILHIVIFGLNLPSSEGIERTWRLSIIYSHLFVAVSLTVLGFLIYWFSSVKKHYRYLSDYSVLVLMAFLLIGGTAITVFDQLVTSSITPFYTICIVSSIVLLIRPLYALLFYVGIYLAFYFSISITQTNADVLISNRVNGITIAGLGIFLSVIFWRSFLIRKKQQRLIEKQQRELMENYSKLSYYADELEESNVTKNKLFSVIAHDLRSPFSSVLGITEMLSDDIEMMDLPEIKATMKVLNRETEITYEFLSNLLDWSVMQLHKFEPRPEKINLKGLTANAIGLLKKMSDYKSIEVINEIPADIYVKADQSMLRSVVKNLLTNSIKFTLKNGQIIIKATHVNEMIMVSVQDTGIGMGTDQVGELFKPGNLNTTYGTENEKGTGLGLQICKEFTEINGGKIWVESELGKGSIFHFTLPAN